MNDERMCRERKESWRIFDRIAPTYDFLNHALSFGQDILWRRRIALFLKGRHDQRVLDLATGTADVPVALCKCKGLAHSVIGIDMSTAMLDIGRKKVLRHGLSGKIELIAADALAIPFPANSFDIATMAFGIRNVADRSKAFSEMLRVLTPGGRAVIVEFSLPSNFAVRHAYLLYFRKVLPALGAWISRDPAAYRYLNRTVETFPCGNAFCELLRQAGFSSVSATPLTFGVATVYCGDKPPA